jgi:hypothetical protein
VRSGGGGKGGLKREASRGGQGLRRSDNEGQGTGVSLVIKGRERPLMTDNGERSFR